MANSEGPRPARSLGVDLGGHFAGGEVDAPFQELLGRCDVEGALRLIARTSATQAGTTDGGRRIPGFQLAMVVRWLLEAESNAEGRDLELRPAGLASCCAAAAAAVSSPATTFGVPAPEGAEAFEHRIAYQQLPDSESLYVSRSRLLYREIAPRLQGSVGFAFEKAYEDRYGIGLDATWAIGRAIYHRSLSNPGAVFAPGDLTGEPGLEDVAETDVESFLGIMACGYDEFRQMLDVPLGQSSHFEPYNLNPMRRHPIIRLPDGPYILPVPAFLLRRLSHGLYYDLVDLDRQGFVQLIGQTFDAYLGRLLEAQPGKLLPLEPGRSWVLRHDDDAIIIRSLTRPFGALSRATGDYDHIHSDVARRGGVVDCVKELQALVDGPPVDGHGEAVHELLRARRVVGLVVALEDFYLANGPLIRRVVDEELAAQGGPAAGASIQMAHVAGLEAICSLALQTGRSLTGLMTEKASNPGVARLELSAYADYLAASLLPGPDIDLTPAILSEIDVP